MTDSAGTRSRVSVLLGAIAVALALLLATAVQAGAPVGPVDAYRVLPGDTLWEIAADRTGSGDDIRGTVFEIRRLNGLDGSLIRPGQVLRVPTAG
ncbi:MAG: LysM peptidoglycan-binding domain-containing protein [Acidimicrobiia bacterium]